MIVVTVFTVRLLLQSGEFRVLMMMVLQITLTMNSCKLPDPLKQGSHYFCFGHLGRIKSHEGIAGMDTVSFSTASPATCEALVEGYQIESRRLQSPNEIGFDPSSVTESTRHPEDARSNGDFEFSLLFQKLRMTVNRKSK